MTADPWYLRAGLGSMLGSCLLIASLCWFEAMSHSHASATMLDLARRSFPSDFARIQDAAEKLQAAWEEIKRDQLAYWWPDRTRAPKQAQR